MNQFSFLPTLLGIQNVELFQHAFQRANMLRQKHFINTYLLLNLG